MTPEPYEFKAIERKWQDRWESLGAFQSERYPTRPTYFVLVYPPYPNGKIHIGHVRNYTIGDTVARYQRMRGRSVLHPIGFDAFGLPNEIEASRQGIGPEELTRRNIDAMKDQLRRLGYSYDWNASITTIEPDYYKWNQWLFLRLLERGLAYRKAARVQWCPSCRTSLANEQVVDECCWRCHQRVLSRYLPQWFYSLGHYAEELWDEIRDGAFPENIGTMIADWLGRSDGAELSFPIEGSDRAVDVFTTKPELAYGATYLALSTEHPLVETLARGGLATSAVERLRRRVIESEDPATMTDGLDTGARGRHPLTGESIPVWLAAYVDPELGTGAVMGNPCHDASDHAFGVEHGLTGRAVVSSDGQPWSRDEQGPYLGEGILFGCGPFSGRHATDARSDVIRDWESRAIGRGRTVYAIRDWLISRQRGWGTPIPVVHCDDCGVVALTEGDLPVRLPSDLRDVGQGNPLEKRQDFLACNCPGCGRDARRETDTMDTFLDTAWYYLRSTNPDFAGSLCDPRAVARWGPADLYVGGIEISVPIMLYGSFVAKSLRDAGLIDFSLPCRQLLAHEMVLKDGRKMSKSLGNAVEPEELVGRFGADALRLLILSLAPPLRKIEWSESRLRGCHRFLARVWGVGVRHAARAAPTTDQTDGPAAAGDRELIRETHELIAAVTREMDRLRPNTAITMLIKFLYRLEKLDATLAGRRSFHHAVAALVKLLSVFAPHSCEELWERLGNSTTLVEERWPEPNPVMLSASTVRVTVKVNARAVARLEVPTDATREQALALAHGNEAVRKVIGTGEVVREIYVAGQIINIVTS